VEVVAKDEPSKLRDVLEQMMGIER
jgi:hypothetical protein